MMMAATMFVALCVSMWRHFGPKFLTMFWSGKEPAKSELPAAAPVAEPVVAPIALPEKESATGVALAVAGAGAVCVGLASAMNRASREEKRNDHPDDCASCADPDGQYQRGVDGNQVWTVNRASSPIFPDDAVPKKEGLLTQLATIGTGAGLVCAGVAPSVAMGTLAPVYLASIVDDILNGLQNAGLRAEDRENNARAIVAALEEQKFWSEGHGRMSGKRRGNHKYDTREEDETAPPRNNPNYTPWKNELRKMSCGNRQITWVASGGDDLLNNPVFAYGSNAAKPEPDGFTLKGEEERTWEDSVEQVERTIERAMSSIDAAVAKDDGTLSGKRAAASGLRLLSTQGLEWAEKNGEPLLEIDRRHNYGVRVLVDRVPLDKYVTRLAEIREAEIEFAERSKAAGVDLEAKRAEHAAAKLAWKEKMAAAKKESADKAVACDTLKAENALLCHKMSNAGISKESAIRGTHRFRIPDFDPFGRLFSRGKAMVNVTLHENVLVTVNHAFDHPEESPITEMRFTSKHIPVNHSDFVQSKVHKDIAYCRKPNELTAKSLGYDWDLPVAGEECIFIVTGADNRMYQSPCVIGAEYPWPGEDNEWSKEPGGGILTRFVFDNTEKVDCGGLYIQVRAQNKHVVVGFHVAGSPVKNLMIPVTNELVAEWQSIAKSAPPKNPNRSVKEPVKEAETAIAVETPEDDAKDFEVKLTKTQKRNAKKKATSAPSSPRSNPKKEANTPLNPQFFKADGTHKVCHAFAETGKCAFGNKCRYSHVAFKKQSGSSELPKNCRPAALMNSYSSTLASSGLMFDL